MIEATLKVSPPLTVLGPTTEPPAEGVAFRNDGIAERTLYFDGVEVGFLTTWPRFEFESIWEWGKPTPTEHVVTQIELQCVLNKIELQCVLNWPIRR